MDFTSLLGAGNPITKYLMIGMTAIILIGGGLGYWYYKDSQNTIALLNADVATYKTNEVTLNKQIEDQNDSIKRLDAQRKIDQVKLDKLSKDYTASRDKVNDLRRVLSKHDIGYLAQEKPGLVEKIVNKGTAKIGKEIEQLSQPEETPNE